MDSKISKELSKQIEREAKAYAWENREFTVSASNYDSLKSGFTNGATAYAHYKERWEQAKKTLEAVIEAHDSAAWTTIEGEKVADEARNLLASWKDEGKEGGA